MNMFPEYIKYNIFDDNILNDIDEINKDFKITENKNKPFKYIILDDFLKPEVHTWAHKTPQMAQQPPTDHRIITIVE